MSFIKLPALLLVLAALTSAKSHPGQSKVQDFDAHVQTQLETSSKPANQVIYTRENGQAYPQPAEAQRVGATGPLLLQDSHLIEHLAHFNRERIPERVVHARGAGAHGTFTVTTDFASKYTMMDVFSKVGQKTSISVRFSTVGGESGSADQNRDPRGFGMKFRTKKGIWDLVMNNTPVFFIRDPAKFPLFIHTQKRHPSTHSNSHDDVWDYMSSNPESLLQFLRLFSDLGTPQGFTHMNGWSGHTYRWVKKNGEWVYVRIYAETAQGVANYTAAEASKIAGASPDHATLDLYNRIESGNFPKWTMYAQVMTAKQAESFRYNIFDLTKDWPFDMVKPHEIGVFELNQNPVNYFSEIEQLSMAPSNTVDGWEPSEDPVLQSRLFAYADAARYRLGANHMNIPVNCPMNPVANFQRDGYMATLGNQGSRPGYLSTVQSIGLAPRAYRDDNHTVWTAGALRYMSEISDIDFEQPRNFWRGLSKTDQANLISNVVGHLGTAKNDDIKRRVVKVFKRADAKMGSLLAAGLKV